jgi:RNA-directed DNA polymerase
MGRITKADGSECDLWSARDAVVLKALTIVLTKVLPVSPFCTHVKGHGGAKAAVRQVRAQLATNRCVLRTDVGSYYASIDHVLLIHFPLCPGSDCPQSDRAISAAHRGARRMVLGL